MIAWVLVGVFALSFAGLLLLYIATLCVYKRKLALVKSKQFQVPNNGFGIDGNICYQPGLNKDENIYDNIKD